MDVLKDKILNTCVERLDSFLSESISDLETITPDLKNDNDAYIADDIRELCEDIRTIINKDAKWI